MDRCRGASVAGVLGLLLLAPLCASVAAEDGTILVADSREGKVFVLAAADLGLRRTLDVGAGARRVTLSAGGDKALVSRPIYNKVAIIDTRRWAIEHQVALASEQDRRPVDKRYYPVDGIFWGESWWIACGWRDRLARLTSDGAAVAERLDLRLAVRDSLEAQPIWPARLAVGPQDNLLFTAFRAGRIGRVVPAGGPGAADRIELSEPLCLSPWGLVALDRDRLVVASMDDDQVLVVDAATLRPRARWTVSGGPMIVAAAAAPNAVLVGLRTGRAVIRLDLETGETLARRGLGAAPGGIGLLDEQQIVATVPAAGEVVRLSLPDLEVAAEHRLGAAPEGLAVLGRLPPEAATAGDEPGR